MWAANTSQNACRGRTGCRPVDVPAGAKLRVGGDGGTSVETSPPRPESGRELKAVLETERAGHPFLLYRDGDGDQRLVVLEDPSLGWMFIEGGPRLAGGLAEAVSAKLCG